MARTQGEADDPFDTPEKAYTEAERRIAAAKATNATELTVQFRYLERLPPTIAGLTCLEILVLDGTPVADLAPLARLTALRGLSLDFTQVTDLAPLAGLTSLQTLLLDGTAVADLAPLAGLTALEWLSLDGTAVADLAPLAHMTRMIDEAHHAWTADTEEFRRARIGMHYSATPVAASPPFDRLSRLQQPARTIETINEIRRRAGLPPHVPGGKTQPLPEPELPRQGIAIRYTAPDDGPIDVDRGIALDGRERDKLGGMQSEMLEALRELRQLTARSNGYTDLTPTVDKYLAALDHPVVDLRDGDLEILYARGVRIQDAYQDLQDEIGRGHAPDADRRLRSPMQIILQMHGPFLLSTKRGNELYAQTEHDQRTRDQELAFQKKRMELNKALREEAPEIATPSALEENEEATASISSRRQPERGAVSGRNANRNFDIALSDVARRFVRRYFGTPQGAAIRLGTLTASGIAIKAAAATKAGIAVTAATTSAMEIAMTGGAAISMQAADFMVRHANDYRELAQLGGASYEWLRTQIDWLVSVMKRIRIVVDPPASP